MWNLASIKVRVKFFGALGVIRWGLVTSCWTLLCGSGRLGLRDVGCGMWDVVKKQALLIVSGISFALHK